MRDNLEAKLYISVPSPVQRFQPDWANAEALDIWVKRDDLVHPIISGNKWRKLNFALAKALDNGCQHILSFGGGHSNHLHALAFVCHQLDIKFTAIVRGNYTNNLTATLADLTRWRTHIEYLDKLTYQKRSHPDYLRELQHKYPDAMIVPEGGSQQAAIQGVAEILSELDTHFDVILCPVASGATLAGLVQAAPSNTQVIGIGVLKGEGYLESLVNQFLSESQQSQQNWQIMHQFHHGGYAKVSDELRQFCQQQTQIPIEPVYSGKLFYAFKQLVAGQHFRAGSRVLLLHTGGMQGAR